MSRTYRRISRLRVAVAALLLALVGMQLAAGAALAQVNGEIQRVWMDHNVFEDGEKGMRIHVEFTARDMRNADGRLVAYFSFADGADLRDYNDRYNTSAGDVSVGRNFTPSYASSHYGDFKLFIPYDELHLDPGEYQLSFNVVAFHTLGDGYTEFARSNGHRFSYDSRPSHTNGEGEFDVDSLAAGFTPDPHTVSLRAEGRIPASNGCSGYITGQADYTLYWSGNSDLLRFYVESYGEDTVLYISDPDDVIFCDDDSGDGADAAISFNNPKTGRYDVWVGTFNDSRSFAAELNVTELTGAGAQATRTTPTTVTSGGGPSHANGAGEFGEHSLSAGFTPDPHNVRLRAVGQVAAPNCSGYVTERADYTLHWSGNSDLLRFYVESYGEDTVLYISDPDDVIFCDDDGGDGADAAISFNNPKTGQYDVWVGTYGAGEAFDAELRVTELR